ncbi:origin recognition complex subunit 5-like [Asterias rubens]|uniref:origin recognition complex subunit 5-like n=1 Tax=Asterias rubens TaxID=7604 RepID=UPI001455C439|nr:origin recognition complex subunit 5-like [Asterias rubens]XP_033646774.1 origin recognition complex subunit 5-like [Asterias rubens]
MADVEIDSECSNINQMILCRQKQVALLKTLMGEPSQPTCPSVFIYGHGATGKTLVVSTLLMTMSLPHAIVNCIECQSSRQLLVRILDQVANHEPRPENNYCSLNRCENMSVFVRLLKKTIEERGIQDQTVYIVLDKAERLRNMDANILPAFLNLSQLSGCNVCVVLLSQIVWEKFLFGFGSNFFEPFVMHFPDYTKNELLHIIAKDTPEGYSADFYSSYVNLLMSIFYMVCRDLNEIRHLAQLNFPKYVEPITKGEATERDSHKLWRHIEPHLKKALQTVYLREVTSEQWEKYQLGETSQQGLPSQPSSLSSRAQIELPFYSKYLLIAAYLASYNPARYDRRFFSKHHGKIKKSAVNRKKETSHQLLGPKAFPLDRLMAIFYSIVDSRVAPTANVFSQISSLVTLQLLAQVGHEDQLDTPKYKCTVSLEFIRSIARTVSFDVIRYLYDFVK